MDTRVGAYALIIREDAVLLSHWTAGDLWTLPGGGIEFGEQPTDAAVREVFEETGYRARLGRLILTNSIVTPAERRLHGTVPLHSIRIVWEATVVGGQLAHEADGSSDEARWAPLAELGSLPVSPLVFEAISALRQPVEPEE